MKLEKEWNQRIQIWMEQLKKDFYLPLQEIEVDYFTTFECIEVNEASQYKFQPALPGMVWGEKWEYGWFKMQIVLPEAAKDKRVVLRPGIGGEMLVFVNGRASGSVDLQHDEITLCRQAVPGMVYEILLESYAGHGKRLEHAGPVMPEEVIIPPVTKPQCMIKPTTFGLWNEEAYQLYMDVFVLDQVKSILDTESLRAFKIQEGLEAFTRIVEFEQELEKRNETYRVAREALKPLLACRNGSTAPEFTVFGQSHLDLAWKWTWEETRRKCGRTYSTQIELMKEYPDYHFLLCEPPILESIEKDYPALYQEILEQTKAGRMYPEGGMYVEADTNLSSGESLVRQFLYGKKWFKETFDLDSKLLWLPDCFGFCGQLPQIMKKAGILYFATQKIARALEGCDPFPYSVFNWEGIDGSKVLTCFFKKNNAVLTPANLSERWQKDIKQKEKIDSFLFPFGYGDGGGGATRDILEVQKRVKDLEGLPRTKSQSPMVFFEDMEKKKKDFDTYSGELYLAWHRGTYTSQASTKRGNRKTEIALRNAEILGCMTQDKELLQRLTPLWKQLLFLQFHDILPGTSIERVHEQAKTQFAAIIKQAEEYQKEAIEQLIKLIKADNEGNPNHEDKGIAEQTSENCVLVINTLSWERSGLIELPSSFGRPLCNGKQLQVQETGGKREALVTVPSMGSITITNAPTLEGQQKTEESFVSLEEASVPYEESFVSVEESMGSFLLENEHISAKIDSMGQLVSLIEKRSGTEFMQAAGNHFALYKDVNISYDAWELSSFYQELPVELDSKAKVSLLTQGMLYVSLLVQKRINNSWLEQEIRLYRNSRRIEFSTVIEWKERHKLLKVEFPVNVFTEEAYEEIQFGFLKRPTHKSRRYDADRFEVVNHKYTALSETGRTFAVYNDCKYGVSTTKNSIELTLLKAPVIPDDTADQGRQEFLYAVSCEAESFENSDVIQQGYECNIPLIVSEPFSLKAGDRKDTLGTYGAIDGFERNEAFLCGAGSLLTISEKAVILEAMKLAEDGSGDIILRLYESKKTHCRTTITTSFPVAAIRETNLLEEDVTEDIKEVSFVPFEIKTLRLILKR